MQHAKASHGSDSLCQFCRHFIEGMNATASWQNRMRICSLDNVDPDDLQVWNVILCMQRKQSNVGFYRFQQREKRVNGMPNPDLAWSMHLLFTTACVYCQPSLVRNNFIRSTTLYCHMAFFLCQGPFLQLFNELLKACIHIIFCYLVSWPKLLYCFLFFVSWRSVPGRSMPQSLDENTSLLAQLPLRRYK